MGFFKVNIKFKNKAGYNAISKRIERAEKVSCFKSYTLTGSPANGEVAISIDRSKSSTEAIALVLLFTNDLHRDCSVINFQAE